MPKRIESARLRTWTTITVLEFVFEEMDLNEQGKMYHVRRTTEYAITLPQHVGRRTKPSLCRIRMVLV
jgi:hypothetical protein